VKRQALALLGDESASGRRRHQAPTMRARLGVAPIAVVVGGDINGLGVVRSLAREGVPTYLLSSTPRDPAMWTRHGKKAVIGALSGQALVTALLDLRDEFYVDPVLLLTQEASVKTVSNNLGRIQSCYQIAMPDGEVMHRLMDKARFQGLAEKLGFPIPRAVQLVQSSDLAAVEQLGYPCVLKPVVKTPAYEAHCNKAYKINNQAELRAIVAEIADTAVMIAQEWIEGGDDQIFFCLQYRTSEATIASFTGRKLRSWPPRTGGTASCVAAPEVAEQLDGMTDAFFTAVGFFGLGSMEYKRDVRTGRFLMIEPTVGRTDFQEEVATLNGVNIPFAAYCSLRGNTVLPAPRTSPPAAWTVSPIDDWSSELQPDGARGFPKGIRRYDALRRIGDPLPWCYAAAAAAKTRLMRLSTRAIP
jgi:predicted ATP-grasp superfamily ATP-dependent carboligase